MIRVVHLGKFYPPPEGGMEAHLMQICEYTKDLVEVRALVSNHQARRVDEIVHGVTVTRLASYGMIARTPLTPGFFPEISKSTDDILHLHVPNPLPSIAVLASIKKSQRLVITHHSDIINQPVLGRLFSPVVDAIYDRADAIIATSPNYIETSPLLRARRYKCKVIPLSIDVERTLAHCSVEASRKLKEQAGKPVILAIGRMVRYKGFEFLIDAMRHVDAELWLVGTGPLKEDLERRSRGIEHKVKFLGRVGNIADYCAACDMVALPSINRSEAFAIVQLEAMAFGKPVINTSLDSGVPFVSRHNETGLTVPPYDSQALADAINTLLQNPELRHRMGQAAFRRVRNVFSVVDMVKSTIELYRSMRDPVRLSAQTFGAGSLLAHSPRPSLVNSGSSDGPDH